jgi:hypothetical protein
MVEKPLFKSAILGLVKKNHPIALSNVKNDLPKMIEKPF